MNFASTMSNDDSEESTDCSEEATTGDTGADGDSDVAESTQLPSEAGSESCKRKRSENEPESQSSAGEPLMKKTFGVNDLTRVGPSGVTNSRDSWHVRVIPSTRGRSKLRTETLFASFDQCHGRAGGWAACSAIAAVNARWLLSSGGVLPTKAQLESLILEGSAAWRRLNPEIASQFDDGYLELETVTDAGVGSIEISKSKSLIGFFGTERIDALKEAMDMSVDKIWERLTMEKDYPRVYIVSWNSHFFVLMAASEGVFYVVDSYGARLFPGCDCAYILRFDGSTVITGLGLDGAWRPVCHGGNNCCLEFIESFLAAPVIRSIKDDESDTTVIYKKAQIEFHCIVDKSESSLPAPCSSSAPSLLGSCMYKRRV